MTPGKFGSMVRHELVYQTTLSNQMFHRIAKKKKKNHHRPLRVSQFTPSEWSGPMKAATSLLGRRKTPQHGPELFKAEAEMCHPSF